MGLVGLFDLRTDFSTTGDLVAAGLGGAISWGGFLATVGRLATLSGGFAPLWRRLPAEDVCGVNVVRFVTTVDGLNGLPTTDGDLTPPGPALPLGALFSPAAAAFGGLGAMGGATVGRTNLDVRDGPDFAEDDFTTAGLVLGLALVALFSPAAAGAFRGLGAMGSTNLGVRDGSGSADGGFTNVRPVFPLVAVPLPAVFPVAGRSAVLSLTAVGRCGAFLSLAGRDGFLWSFWSAGDGLRAICAFVVALPWSLSSDATTPGVDLRAVEACAGVGRGVGAALVFNRTVNALPVGLTCLEAG
ncbi:MAG: hypothetical protein OXC47_04710 [Cyanobacteria bacterium MAG APA_bin_95]|nr:hypothetical protein [Cyanobacteria bacterium MAG APA_bin_95]